MVSVRDVATRWSAVDVRVRRTPGAVPWWTALAAIGVPVVLIGGWTVGALLQPAGSYDWTTKSISALASDNAADHWFMTASFVLYGLCQLLTALGLRMIRPVGRIVLAGSGATAVLLAAVPAPPAGGSTRHAMVAGATAILLALWPVFAFDAAGESGGQGGMEALGGLGGLGGHSGAPWFLRPHARALIAVAMLLMIAGYCVVLQFEFFSGVVERMSAAIEAFWLVVVVFTVRRLAGSVVPERD